MCRILGKPLCRIDKSTITHQLDSTIPIQRRKKKSTSHRSLMLWNGSVWRSLDTMDDKDLHDGFARLQTTCHYILQRQLPETIRPRREAHPDRKSIRLPLQRGRNQTSAWRREGNIATLPLRARRTGCRDQFAEIPGHA